MQHGHGGRVLQRGGSLSKLSGTAIVTSSLGDLTQYLGSSPSTGSKPLSSYAPIQAGRPIRLAQTVTVSPSANLWVAIPCSLGAPCCAPHEPPRGIESRNDDDELPGGLVRDVDKGVGCSSGR